VEAIVAIGIALSVGDAQARPFHSVSLPKSLWRGGSIRRGLYDRFCQSHLPKHGAYNPRRIIPRGGSSARAASTPAYADFFDDGMHSDSGSDANMEARSSAASSNQQPYEQSYEEQHYQQQYPQNQQQSGTLANYNQQQYQQEEGVMPLHGHGQLHQDQVAAHAAYVARVASTSRMNCYTISLALRYTCEINRRLRHGTDAPHAYFSSNDNSCRHLHMDLMEGSSTSSSQQEQPTSRQQSWELQHHRHQHQSGVSAPAHHANEWNPPIRRPDPESEVLTHEKNQLSVFHAPSPRRGYAGKPLTGVERWGVEVERYLKEICEKMDCSENVTALVLARALIYLDRACSVETERQTYHGSTHWSAGVPPGYSQMASPCPAIMPRTVHRLILTAIVLSCRALRGQAGPEYDGAYCENFVHFGITPSSLSAMEAAMRDALGTEGLYVDESKLAQYLLSWGHTFTQDQGETKEDVNSSGSSSSDEEDIRIDDRKASSISPMEADFKANENQ